MRAFARIKIIFSGPRRIVSLHVSYPHYISKMYFWKTGCHRGGYEESDFLGYGVTFSEMSDVSGMLIASIFIVAVKPSKTASGDRQAGLICWS